MIGVHTQSAQFAGADMRQERGNAGHHEMNAAREKVHHRRPFASIGDVNHLGLSHETKQLAAQMHDGTKARRSIVALAWIGLQKRDESCQFCAGTLALMARSWTAVP